MTCEADDKLMVLQYKTNLATQKDLEHPFATKPYSFYDAFAVKGRETWREVNYVLKNRGEED